MLPRLLGRPLCRLEPPLEPSSAPAMAPAPFRSMARALLELDERLVLGVLDVDLPVLEPVLDKGPGPRPGLAPMPMPARAWYEAILASASRRQRSAGSDATQARRTQQGSARARLASTRLTLVPLQATDRLKPLGAQPNPHRAA